MTATTKEVPTIETLYDALDALSVPYTGNMIASYFHENFGEGFVITQDFDHNYSYGTKCHPVDEAIAQELLSNGYVVSKKNHRDYGFPLYKKSESGNRILRQFWLQGQITEAIKTLENTPDDFVMDVILGFTSLEISITKEPDGFKIKMMVSIERADPLTYCPNIRHDEKYDVIFFILNLIGAVRMKGLIIGTDMVKREDVVVEAGFVNQDPENTEFNVQDFDERVKHVSESLYKWQNSESDDYSYPR